MEILIIGGSRFVGPVLVNKLLELDHNVTIFNRGQIQSNYPDSVTFVQGDRDAGIDMKEHFDVVVDMCAYDGRQTRALLNQVDFDFFVNFGTSASYKKTEVFPLTEESELGEWAAWGGYNRGKVESEEVLASSGVKYATIRPVYILGQNNYCDREHFIYSRIDKGELITLPGNGEALVQFVFVEDVAKTFATIIDQQLAGAYNCASDEMITLKGLVEYMGTLVGKAPKIAYSQKTDGENWDEDEFPFANENFVVSNDKVKGLGLTFAPLREQLSRDFSAHYKDTL